MIKIGLLAAFLAAFVASVAAAVAGAVYLVLAIRGRFPGVSWWRASFGRGELSAIGEVYRRRGRRLLLMAVVLFIVTSFLATVTVCCPLPDHGVSPQNDTAT